MYIYTSHQHVHACTHVHVHIRIHNVHVPVLAMKELRGLLPLLFPTLPEVTDIHDGNSILLPVVERKACVCVSVCECVCVCVCVT